jgi:hypothetical protein
LRASILHYFWNFSGNQRDIGKKTSFYFLQKCLKMLYFLRICIQSLQKVLTSVNFERKMRKKLNILQKVKTVYVANIYHFRKMPTGNLLDT